MRNFINIIKEGDHTPPAYERDDEEHYDALDKTGFFGAQAAGSIPIAKTTGRIMLALRSQAVEESGTWGNFGGAHKQEEPARTAAMRELHEETGYQGSLSMLPLLRFESGTFVYQNFLAIVDEEFVPDLGWEADTYQWCEFGNWPSPLHFGMVSLFNDASSAQVIQHYARLFSE